MEQDRTKPSDVDAEVQAAGGALRPEPPRKKNLCLSLLPTLDKARQLVVDLGLRPYRVFLIHWRWPRQRGIGKPVEISRREIRPAPRVMSMDGTLLSVAAFGNVEGGGIKLDRISGRFSEDDLMGRTPDLRDPVNPNTNANNVEFFYEVVESRDTDPSPKPRRFAPSAVPHLSRAGMSWTVTLTKQDKTASGITPEVVS